MLENQLFDVSLRVTGPALRVANIHHKAPTKASATAELAIAFDHGQSVVAASTAKSAITPTNRPAMSARLRWSSDAL